MSTETTLRFPMPPRTAAEILPSRVTRVLAMVRQVERLPDTGRHGKECWRTHPDCLAARIDAILTRGAS